MNHYFGLSFIDIRSISKEFDIPESSLYFSDINYIAEIYEVDVTELYKAIERCLENELELER